MTANPTRRPQHITEVAPEDAAVGGQLVDHDIAEVLEQLRPPRMVGKNARVQHVGIAENEMRACAHGPPGILRRVAVVGEDADLFTCVCRKRFTHRLQLGQLILCERFGRKQRWCPVKWWKFSGVVPEFSTRYAIAARISWVVLDTVGVVSCCIDSALK